MSDSELIGAFGEDDAARLTGLSIGRLRAWDRSGLLPASYASGSRNSPYGRVYSFLDIVSLRVLASLRNDHRVSLQHLRKVSEKLAHLGQERWTATTLYVLGRRVVFDDPSTSARQEVVSGQRVFDIPLKIAIRGACDAIRELNVRKKGNIGHIIKDRFIMNNPPVFEGTRIPVSAVEAFIERGFSTSDVLREFPNLRQADVEEALSRMRVAAA